MSKKSSYSISILDDDKWAGVDAWESPGILAAMEAKEAEEEASAIKQKLKSEETTYALLAESAKDHLNEMASLLKKVELSTASKEEMERLSNLDDEMKRLKADITVTKSVLKTCNEDLIRSMTKTKTYAVMKTVKERDIRSVVRFVREAETVDLAFLLDCTSSMSSYIEAAKTSMKEVVRMATRTNAGLKLRVAVVGYRDLCDGHERFCILNFTSSISEFESFVSGLRALGGGDAPEDMAGAVQKANSLSWQQMSRITFVIADAPCHGSKYHSLDDSYPDGTPGICIESELKRLTHQGGQAGMQLHFGRITPHTDKMIHFFSDIGFEFEVCDLEDPRKLASSVTSSVRKSISKSVTASRSKAKSGDFGSCGGKAIKEDYTIREAKPSVDEWESLRSHTVKILCNKPITSINDLKVPLHFGLVRWGKSASSETTETKMLMRRAKDPFAEGEMRLAYYGKLGMDNKSLLSDVKGDKVLKTFKKTRKSSSDRKNYLAQMEVSTIAHFLAEEYNKHCRPSHCPEIRFLEVHIVEVVDGTKEEERYCAEDQLPCAATAFTKFSNNTGYWNEDEINQSLLLFTQFTYNKTGGYLMVTDLQGVRHDNEYILTDPAILCKDNTRFGDTNIGGKFMDKCMEATKAMLEEYGWD